MRRPTPAARRSVLLALPLLAGCASIGFLRAGDGEIGRLLSEPPASRWHVGVLAVDTAGSVVFERNADRTFVPASNQKILVAAAALSRLGPDYRYETGFWGVGSIDSGRLNGDLVLLASGDPSLSSRYWRSGEAALEALVDSLRAVGVREVMGSLVVDVSAWDSTTVGPTREVDDLAQAYGASGGAFAVDEGRIEIVVEGGDPGTPATVRWRPGGADFVRSRVVSVADSATRVIPTFLPESRRLRLDGRVRAGTVDTLSFAIRDPVLQGVEALEAALARAGVIVRGAVAFSWTPGEVIRDGCRTGSVRACSGAFPLASIASPPMSELIAGVLGPSQNWMSEQILLTLGAEVEGRGGWAEGTRVLSDFLRRDVGLDSLDFVVRDGSGLSVQNLVTPRALVRVLQHARGGDAGPAFRAALAEPGERETTLEERLVDLEGRLFAKTGTLTHVSAISGYLTRSDGSELVFSVLSNGSARPAEDVREVVDAVIRELAR